MTLKAKAETLADRRLRGLPQSSTAAGNQNRMDLKIPSRNKQLIVSSQGGIQNDVQFMF